MSVHPRSRPSTDTPVIVIGAGQSGLAAARALHQLNIPVVVLEAGARPAGSWPRCYDSRRLFSPTGFSSMPGMPFPGDPDRYPARDEVADYLDRYAAAVPVEIQTNTRVTTVRQDDGGFSVLTADGRRLTAAGVVAASGSFSKPHRPIFPGQASDQDVHYWLRETGFDALPADWLSKIGEGSLITDSTGLRSA